MRVLVFGDSIAHGMWSVRGGWVQMLRSELDARTISDSADEFPDMYNLGVSADNSACIVRRIEYEIEARKRPELVIVVAIGTNDASKSRVHIELPQYQRNLQKIVTLAHKFTDKILFIGLPSVDEKLTRPWFVDESVSYTNVDLQQYESVAQRICTKQNIPFVPIFERFRAEQTGRNLLPDGLHPNDAGHELIANLVRPEFSKLLHPN